AGRSNSPTRSQRWPVWVPRRAGASTGWCSAVSGTTPGTASTTSRPSSNSLSTARTSGRSSGPGCTNTWRTRGMTEVSDHLSRVLDIARPLPPLEVRLADAVGCVLAHDVRADIDVPARDLAGQDGYAIISRDVEGAGIGRPVELRVLDEVQAGATTPGAVVE